MQRIIDLTSNLELPGSIFGRGVLRQDTISVTYVHALYDERYTTFLLFFLLSPITDSPGKETCRDGVRASARKECLQLTGC